MYALHPLESWLVEKEQSRQAGWKRGYAVCRAAFARFTARKGGNSGRGNETCGLRKSNFRSP